MTRTRTGALRAAICDSASATDVAVRACLPRLLRVMTGSDVERVPSSPGDVPHQRGKETTNILVIAHGKNEMQRAVIGPLQLVEGIG